MKILKIKLCKENESELKKIFKLNFPNQEWKYNVPFVNDDIYAAYDDNTIIGYTFVHKSTPENFPNPKGVYIYNLCTVKHNIGIGTAILNEIKKDFPIIHCNSLNDWFIKNKFVKVGPKEYTYGDNLVYNEIIISSSYDVEENLFYLN